MKQSTTTLTSTLQNVVTKIFFCSQVIIISLSVPSLFYVGITHNNDRPKKHLHITYKGKKTLVSSEESGGTVKYSPAFLQL